MTRSQAPSWPLAATAAAPWHMEYPYSHFLLLLFIPKMATPCVSAPMYGFGASGDSSCDADKSERREVDADISARCGVPSRAGAGRVAAVGAAPPSSANGSSGIGGSANGSSGSSGCANGSSGISDGGGACCASPYAANGSSPSCSSARTLPCKLDAPRPAPPPRPRPRLPGRRNVKPPIVPLPVSSTSPAGAGVGSIPIPGINMLQAQRNRGKRECLLASTPPTTPLATTHTTTACMSAARIPHRITTTTQRSRRFGNSWRGSGDDASSLASRPSRPPHPSQLTRPAHRLTRTASAARQGAPRKRAAPP